MTKLHGLLTALVTPFTGDGAKIDETTLRELIEHNISCGVHGLVPGGSTGEFAALSMPERLHVAEVVVDQAAGRVPVMVGVGAMTTKESIGLAEHAEASGADAVMIVAPYYEPLSVTETLEHFRAVASSISIDVMLYNLPGATGVNLEPAQIAALASTVPNVKYVKDTSGNFTQAAHLIRHYSELVSIFVGWDTLYFAALVEGAAGSVNGAANFIAPELVDIYTRVSSGDVDGARKTWRHVFPIMEFLLSEGYVTRTKAGLDLVGRSAGRPRLPMLPLSAESEAEFKAMLSELRTMGTALSPAR